MTHIDTIKSLPGGTEVMVCDPIEAFVVDTGVVEIRPGEKLTILNRFQDSLCCKYRWAGSDVTVMIEGEAIDALEKGR